MCEAVVKTRNLVRGRSLRLTNSVHAFVYVFSEIMPQRKTSVIRMYVPIYIYINMCVRPYTCVTSTHMSYVYMYIYVCMDGGIDSLFALET